MEYFFSSNLMGYEMGKIKVVMNKLVYLGQAILDLREIIKFEFHYDHMLPKYGENLKLCYKDTDSLAYHIKTEDFYVVIASNVRARFDRSGYNKNDARPLPIESDKKVIRLKATVNGNNGSYSVSTSSGRPEAMMTGSNGGYSISTSGGRPAATMTVNISRTNHPQAAQSNSLEQQWLLEKAVESRYGRGGNGSANYSVNYQYSTVHSVSTMPRKSLGGHATVGGSYQVRYIAVHCIMQVEACVIITCIMIFFHDTEYPPW